MKPTGSLPCSKEPTNGLYPEPDEFSQHPLSCFSMLHLNIVLLSTPRSSKWFLSFRCSYQYHCYFPSHPCAPHAPPISSWFSMLHLYIFPPSAPASSSKRSLPSDVPTKIISFYLPPICNTCFTHHIPLNLITTQHDLVTGHSRNHT